MSRAREDLKDQMSQAFSQLDKNKDSSICRDELRPLLVTVFGNSFPDSYFDDAGRMPDIGELLSYLVIMAKADKNGSGTIDNMDELVDALTSIKAIIICSRLVTLLDSNRDGQVSREELEVRLEQCEHPVVRDLIQDAPFDGRGHITCDDFFGFVLQKLL